MDRFIQEKRNQTNLKKCGRNNRERISLVRTLDIETFRSHSVLCPSTVNRTPYGRGRKAQ